MMSLDPELSVLDQMILPDFADIPVVRAWARMLAEHAPPVDPALTAGLEIEDRRIPGPPGAPEVTVRIYRPTTLAAPAPALVYFHGGSFLMGDLDTDHVACLHYAKQAGCVVVSVDYRLAPEYPYPAGIEDCFAAFAWVTGEAAALRINPALVALGGSSAGGALAAGAALLARDRRAPRPTLQMLIYPALDDRMDTVSMNHQGKSFVVRRDVVGHMWRHYLGAPGAAASPYAAPARATDLSDLCPAYIEAPALDPLRDEGIAYATRLLNGGIPAELHVFPGAPHAFDVIPTAGVTQRAFALRAAALRKSFGLT